MEPVCHVRLPARVAMSITHISWNKALLLLLLCEGNVLAPPSPTSTAERALLSWHQLMKVGAARAVVVHHRAAAANPPRSCSSSSLLQCASSPRMIMGDASFLTSCALSAVTCCSCWTMMARACKWLM